MKKLFTATVSVAALSAAALYSASAFAADLPTKAPVYKAAAPGYNWTGFYVGGDVGALWSNADAHFEGDAGVGVVPVTQSLKDTSVFGGIHIGYNYMFVPSWVAGIEADWSWTGNKASETTAPLLNGNAAGTPPLPGTFVTMSRKIDWLSTVRGRIGYTVLPQALLYATGGFAFGHIEYDAVSLLALGPDVGSTASLSETKTGYVLGGGLEWALTSNWLLRGEYLFHHLNSASATVLTDNVNNPGINQTTTFSWDNNIHTARIGLSYKFGN